MKNHKHLTDEEAEHWIKNKFREIAKAMNFGQLKLNIELKDKAQVADADADVMFMVRSKPQYRVATIYITQIAINLAKENNKEYQSELIDGMVHELCHIHTNIVADAAHERFLTEKELGDKCEEVTEIMAGFVRQNLRHSSGVYK